MAGITQWAVNWKKTKFHQLTCIAVTHSHILWLALRNALPPF